MASGQRFHIHLKPRAARLLEALVDHEDVTRAEIIRKALDAYVDDRIYNGLLPKNFLNDL